MKRVIFGIGVVLLLAGIAWAGSYKHSILVGNAGGTDQEVTSIDRNFNRTAVLCDKEASGSIDVSIKCLGQSDYGANTTIDLTASDRSVVWQTPGVDSVNFSSSDTFTCKIIQWDD